MTKVRAPAAAGKIYHLAGMVRADGAVSARCFKKPRPIDLAKVSWTFLPEQATCKKCLVIAQRDAQEVGGA